MSFKFRFAREHRIAALVCFALLAGTSARAAAQISRRLATGGIDLHLFRPAVDSRGLISLNGGDSLQRNDFSFGLVLDGGFKILPLSGFEENSTRTPDNAQRTQHIVDRMLTGTFLFNYGVLDYLTLGIQLPIQLASGKNIAVPGFYNDANPGSLNYQGLGDVNLYAKMRLLPVRPWPVQLAAILNAQFPSGDARQFTGEPGYGLWPSLAFEVLPIAALRFVFNGGYRWNSGDGATFPVTGRTEPDPTTGSATGAILVDPGKQLRYGDLITFGAGVGWRVTSTLELIGEFYGAQIARQIGEKSSTSMEALAGAKIFVQEHSFLTLGLGGGFPHSSMQAANWRAVVGFVFEPPLRDRDRDGIRDNVDACPNQAEDRDGFQDTDGCPELDNDHDGIPDVSDECANIAEDHDGIEDQDGCPEGALGDRDGDGILDGDDQCPDQPEDRDGFEDEDGCPEPDNDRDGIPDRDDLCPLKAEDRDGFEDRDGCPELDNDRDRIPDIDDRCPQQPETYNGVEDTDGCPDKGSVILEENELVILEKIYFNTNSAEIQNRSDALLDAVAAALRGNPQLKLLEVQGHADSRGSDVYNLKLTRERAAAVVEALITRGIEQSRLRSAGYGELCPLDSRNTAEAWDKNRRVEFKIIETADGPTGVQVTCPAGRKLVPR